MRNVLLLQTLPLHSICLHGHATTVLHTAVPALHCTAYMGICPDQHVSSNQSTPTLQSREVPCYPIHACVHAPRACLSAGAWRSSQDPSLAYCASLAGVIQWPRFWRRGVPAGPEKEMPMLPPSTFSSVCMCCGAGQCITRFTNGKRGVSGRLVNKCTSCEA